MLELIDTYLLYGGDLDDKSDVLLYSLNLIISLT